MRQDFSSAFLKLERAEHHIDQFKAIVRSYVDENLNAMQPVPDADRGTSRALGGPVPIHTPTIIGDAIHNLRTSLDHVYCALVEANGCTVKRHTTFPFHKWKADALASLNGHKKQRTAPSDAAIDFIVNEIKPFEGSDVYGVHTLDIADKHHSLIVAQAVLAIDRIEFIRPDGTPTGGSWSGISFVNQFGNHDGLLGLKGGLGANLYGDPTETFDIRFAEGQPFAGESVAKTLSSLHSVTKGVIDALTPF